MSDATLNRSAVDKMLKFFTQDSIFESWEQLADWAANTLMNSTYGLHTPSKNIQTAFHAACQVTNDKDFRDAIETANRGILLLRGITETLGMTRKLYIGALTAKEEGLDFLSPIGATNSEQVNSDNLKIAFDAGIIVDVIMEAMNKLRLEFLNYNFLHNNNLSAQQIAAFQESWGRSIAEEQQRIITIMEPLYLEIAGYLWDIRDKRDSTQNHGITFMPKDETILAVAKKISCVPHDIINNIGKMPRPTRPTETQSSIKTAKHNYCGPSKMQ